MLFCVFFNHKTAYEMRISDWSSDVCSSDLFDAFTFAFVQTEHGWFQAHAYQFEPGMSTFIVETRDEAWKAAGLEDMSQEDGIAYCEKLFAPWLGGHSLICNATHLRGSAIWIRFPRVICDTWVHSQDMADGRRVPGVDRKGLG